jgi:LmbE family N-acetylglucosaminyl deacetylase
MKRRLLIIAAHPDDDVLGCGGFLAKYKGKLNVKVVFIAEGTSCRFQNIEKDSLKIQKEIDRRNSYGKEALKLLGVNNISFHNLPCGRLDSLPIITINKIIESEIKKFKPEIVMTHSEDDTNNDHRIIFRSTLMATRPGAFPGLEKLISYEVLSSSEWNFTKVFLPNHFESLQKRHILLKCKALACFKSETRKYPHPRSNEGLIALASYRGIQSGFKFAEAYQLIRNFQK